MKVAVLMGGISSEREISLKSGKAVSSALNKKGFDVTEIDIESSNLNELLELTPDVAFITLHGRFGEDGTIQKMLEKRGIAYTGSGPSASRLAFDKLSSKVIFMLSGMKTPDFTLVNKAFSDRKIMQIIAKFGLPVVVKPRAEGSSIGISIHKSISTVLQGVKEAMKLDRDVIIERLIDGLEVTVGVLNEKPLPIIIPKTENKFFDFDAKYKDDSTIYVIDPPFSDKRKEKISSLALQAHQVLGCSGFSRVDMILSDDIYVLEVNSIPGLTERSLVPMAAKHAGTSFPDLCSKIIDAAFTRKQNRIFNKYRPSSHINNYLSAPAPYGEGSARNRQAGGPARRAGSAQEGRVTAYPD